MHGVQLVGFVGIFFVTPFHRGVDSLIDDALVVDHILEPSIDDGCTWRHWPMEHRGNFRGRALALFNSRLSEVEW